MSNGKEFAFIDGAVFEPQQLRALLRSDIEAVSLDSTQPALGQIAKVLSASSAPATAVHIFSHGHAGSVDFSSGMLNASSIEGQTDSLINIGDAMLPDASIHLWS